MIDYINYSPNQAWRTTRDGVQSGILEQLKGMNGGGTSKSTDTKPTSATEGDTGKSEKVSPGSGADDKETQ